jgi:hypothetical protein
MGIPAGSIPVDPLALAVLRAVDWLGCPSIFGFGRAPSSGDRIRSVILKNDVLSKSSSVR